MAENANQSQVSYSTSDLAAELAAQFNFTKAKALRIVTAVCGNIINALADDKAVRLHQFGVFKRIETGERKGHNPKTGEETIIEAGARAHFTASSVMKESCKNRTKVTIDAEPAAPAAAPIAAPKAGQTSAQKPAPAKVPQRKPIARPASGEPAGDVDEI